MRNSAQLILEDGTIFTGEQAGFSKSTNGEVVFSTGMVGYEQSLTDPSYKGQILTFTYPLIGNWGVPPKKYWESDKIQVQAVVICDLTTKPNHYLTTQTLNDWLIEEKVPAIIGVDTRKLTQKLRERGVMLGKIIINNNDIDFWDPNKTNLVEKVSSHKLKIYGSGSLKIGLLNCGVKENIKNCLLKCGVKIYELPWNYDPFENKISLDGLVVSNGPGNPKVPKESVTIIKRFMKEKIPIFGICLGNQLLALAAGGNTIKLKFGHRAQNQPTTQVGTNRCFITTHNHGYAVSGEKIPQGFKPWFINANDNTIEGIIHKNLPFFSVQFHPEATPGPSDTEFLFDFFIDKVKKRRLQL